ncbi:MAG TPA: hypothetical protein PK167_03475 [Prolixibacteraceae bacterium]|nr:hypothetical protein [Prolixibacteraceae bacterium]
MSETITNLKVRFGADTSNFKKGMSEGEKAMNDFKENAGGAFDQFAAAFGVNMDALRGGISSVQKNLFGLGSALQGATAGSGGLIASLKLLKVALISTGIGALIVALGSLISYFTKTERGAEWVEKVMKQIGAVVNVLVDRVSALGETIFKAFEDPKQAISDLWEALKKNIVNRFEGLIDLFKAVGGGLEALFNRDIKGLETAAVKAGFAVTQMMTGLDAEQQVKLADGIRGIVKEMSEEARIAGELQDAREKLEDQEIALIEIQAKRRKEINAARLLAKDETVSADERLKAMQRAADLEKKTLAENLALQRERVRIMAADIDLAESTDEDYRALAEAKAAVHDIEAESLRTQKRLQTEINTLTNEIERQTEAIKKKREEELKGAALKIDPVKTSLEVNTKGLETEKLQKWADQQKKVFAGAENVIINFADVFNSSMQGLAENFGEKMGEVIAGTAGFEDIGIIILGSLGDLAVQVGKISIGAGLAVLGIKEALMSLNPAVAIAAGIALVALGSAVKSSLKGAATGGSGGTFSGQSGGVYDLRSSVPVRTNAVSAEPQKIAVEITGTSKIRGNDIYTSYENARRNRKLNT